MAATTGRASARKCAVCRRAAVQGGDLCDGCDRAAQRIYGNGVSSDQNTNNGQESTNMATRKAAGGAKGGAKRAGREQELFPLPKELRTDSDGNAVDTATMLDHLYEVVAGDTDPGVYGFEDRGQAAQALTRSFGNEGNTVYARAVAAWDKREQDRRAAGELAAKRASEVAERERQKAVAARHPELSFPTGDEDEDEDEALDNDVEDGDAGDGGDEASGEGGMGESAAADEGLPPVLGGGAPAGGGEAAEEKKPYWRKSPAGLLKSALRPLSSKWCDWAKLEAQVPGVVAARALLENAYKKQLSIELAERQAAPKKGQAKVEPGAKARIKAKAMKDYEGVLTAEEAQGLTVKTIAGKYAHCVTAADEKAIILLAHLEATG